MVSQILSPLQHCADFLIEPYHQGFQNIRDAFLGTKVESVAQNALDTDEPERELSLVERISSALS